MTGELKEESLFTWTDYSIASSTINQLRQDNTKWVEESFISYFEDKYRGINISLYDEISLLMYEVILKYDEKAVFDVFNAGFVNCNTFHSKIYLFNKAIFYCNNYFWPFKIYGLLEGYAKFSSDYRLLADSLRYIFDKYAEEVMDGLVLKGVENHLKKAKALMNNNYEKITLAFSLKYNNFDDEARELFFDTLERIVWDIEKDRLDDQYVIILLSQIEDEYQLLFTYKDINLEWNLRFSNELYTALSERESRKNKKEV